MQEDIREELLEAWLQMSLIISNRRLTDGMPFNEAMVCHILEARKKKDPDVFLTATDLCQETRMQKSLMNSTLNSMEKKEWIERIRSERDKRQSYIRLREENLTLYRESHEKVLQLLDQILEEVGEQQIRQLIPGMKKITDVVKSITAAMD